MNQTEFSALILGHPAKVQRRTQGGVYEYTLQEKLEDGVYTFSAYGFNAEKRREATLEERESAMQSCPIINALTSMWNEEEKLWFCHPLNLNQTKKYRGLHFPVPLFLAPAELSILQPVQAWITQGYGRRVLIFKDLHLRYPPDRLDKLRQAVKCNSFPEAPEITYNKLKPTLEEYDAFLFARESLKPPIERLIMESLDFVGAIFIEYEDLGNGQYKIHYEYKGISDQVIVNQKMTVVDAGICLVNRHGQHYKGHVDYDLASMVIIKWKGRH